mmetsp:Transcript_64503/g.167674  ORF Transcript_64503/g.167674 Transcript_64503/m.167674 type:complete len:263 (-) Transcript_64503:528-1316(-)
MPLGRTHSPSQAISACARSAPNNAPSPAAPPTPAAEAALGRSSAKKAKAAESRAWSLEKSPAHLGCGRSHPTVSISLSARAFSTLASAASVAAMSPLGGPGRPVLLALAAGCSKRLLNSSAGAALAVTPAGRWAPADGPNCGNEEHPSWLCASLPTSSTGEGTDEGSEGSGALGGCVGGGGGTSEARGARQVAAAACTALAGDTSTDKGTPPLDVVVAAVAGTGAAAGIASVVGGGHGSATSAVLCCGNGKPSVAAAPKESG